MPEADRIELSVEGNRILRFHSTGLKLINGSPSQPSYAFLNAGNSGFYRAGPGQVGFAADGSEMMRLTTTGLGIGVTSPSEPLEVSGNALAGAHTTPSDVRLKTNVREIENATDLVRQLRGVRFEWNDSGRNGDRAGSPDVGFIAQEVLNVIPEIVSGSDEDYYSVDYSRLVPILLEAIKEQQRRIEVLEARIGS
jgi:hypothetical protein